MDIIHLFSRNRFQHWQACERKGERQEGWGNVCVTRRVKDREEYVCVLVINSVLTIGVCFGNMSNVRPVKVAELNWTDKRGERASSEWSIKGCFAEGSSSCSLSFQMLQSPKRRSHCKRGASAQFYGFRAMNSVPHRSVMVQKVRVKFKAAQTTFLYEVE